MSKKRASPPAGGAAFGPSPRKTRSAYQTVVVLPIAAKEGRGFLTAGQYLHIKDLEKQLAGFGRREFESQLRIEKLGEFWELKEKGGVLGRKNVRVYFKNHEKERPCRITTTPCCLQGNASTTACGFLRIIRQGQKENEIVVLCTYKKEDDGRAPDHIHIKLKNRWRMYLNGDFKDNVITYRRPET